jgi:MFS family permease
VGSDNRRGIVVRLLAGHGINGFGDGLWFSIWAIFFTRVQHIPAEQMGVAVGLGGAIGLLAAVPAGVLADRRGPREVLAAVVAFRGLVMILFIFVGGFWSLLAVTALFAAAQSAAVGIRVTLVYGLMPADGRLRLLAQSRVVQHIAYAVGAGGATVVLAVGTRPAFVVAVLANAVTFVANAWLIAHVPRVAPVPPEHRQATTRAVRDLPYGAIMMSTAVLALCWSILSSGLPLWIANDTSAGIWMAGVAIAISSGLIALFQIRVTRDGAAIGTGVRNTWISAVALAGCCVIFAAAAWPRSPLLAMAILVAGVIVHVIGELYYVASRWKLSLDLMARGGEGQYQGVAASTEAIAIALGPAAVTAAVSGLGVRGWLILGGAFIVAVLPVRLLVGRAMRDQFRVANLTEPVPAEARA